MKNKIVILASMLVVGVLSAFLLSQCNPVGEAPQKYIIMLAPWLATPVSKGAAAPIPRNDAKEKLLNWGTSLSPKILGKTPFSLLSGPKYNMDVPAAGASIFTAWLTPTAAQLLQESLPFFFVSPYQDIVPVPFDNLPADNLRKNSSSTPAPNIKSAQTTIKDEPEVRLTPQEATWGVNCNVIETVPRTFTRSPVFYVVDTGVQPFVGGSTNDWHPQLKEAITAGRVKIRQGRVPDSLEVWPPANPQNNVWEQTPIDQLIDLPSALLPIPALPNTMANVHPYLVDGTGSSMGPNDMHGTQVAIAALGMCAAKNTGMLGRFTITGPAENAIELESIRVYPGGVSPAANVDALKGILLAIDAHEARVAAAGGAIVPSVLVFASRTTTAFDQTLEAALWWAWKRGIICVVAAGNSPVNTSPKSRWYTAKGVISTTGTSPSRFDWDVPVQNPATQAYWPNWQQVQNPPGNPYPHEPYLIEVGVTNATSASPDNANWGTWVVGGVAKGSSKGRDVDILTSGVGVACAMTNTNTDTDALMLNSGTSFGAGYVAGAALVYLASAPAPTGTKTWPEQFRSWLLPAGAAPPAYAPSVIKTTGLAGVQSPAATTPLHVTPTANYNKVPKLKISLATNNW